MAESARMPLSELNSIAMAPPLAPTSALKAGITAPDGEAFSNLATHLDHTLSPDEGSRNGAIDALKSMEQQVGFCCALLSELKDPACPLARQLCAAAYLKNFVRKTWPQQDALGDAERNAFRAQLLDILLASQISEIRNMLAEVLRLVAAADFPANWPALLPTLSQELAEQGAAWGQGQAACPGSAASHSRLFNAVLQHTTDVPA